MDFIEKLANLSKTLRNKIQQLKNYEKEVDILLVADSVKIIIVTNWQMKELYDEICNDEKEMEDLIFDCIEVFFHSIYFIVQFYDVELPELENYRQSLKEMRSSVLLSILYSFLQSRQIWSRIQKKISSKRLISEINQLLERFAFFF